MLDVQRSVHQTGSAACEMGIPVTTNRAAVFNANDDRQTLHVFEWKIRGAVFQDI